MNVTSCAREKKTENVGILALEVYFPKTYVDQAALEEYDKASKGKYTIGLGQKQMGFCGDNEDINSLCLTVVSHLMEKNNICYSKIGRLEVGTETIIDKSKSVKTALMQLFESSGNFDVEGVDTTNACYGGTSALFNAVAWVESSSWDGRYALVVCGDIAVYASGNARCTGGAGAIAMLIGKSAPLVIEPGLRGSCMRHTYDFYKPDLTSEYPYVDGNLSIKSYLTALDFCYATYCKKAMKKLNLKNAFSLENFDFMMFHSPFCKMVQKSFARLMLNDYVRKSTSLYTEEIKKDLYKLDEVGNVSLEESIGDRKIEKLFVEASRVMFDCKTRPSLLLPQSVGNMYTPSLYSCLVSLLLSVPPSSLAGKRIGMFSYGSGFASSLFSIYVPDDKEIVEKLQQLIIPLSDVETRLDSRICVPPADFTAVLECREKSHGQANYKPKASADQLFPGTFYLTHVDEKYRRSYERKPQSSNQHCSNIPASLQSQVSDGNGILHNGF